MSKDGQEYLCVVIRDQLNVDDYDTEIYKNGDKDLMMTESFNDLQNNEAHFYG